MILKEKKYDEFKFPNLRRKLFIKIKIFCNILVLHFRMLRLGLWRYSSLESKIELFCNIPNICRPHCIRQFYFLLIKKIKKNKFPEKINIETVSFCNSHCICCPSSELSKVLPQGKMSMDLYRKIIDECSQYPIKMIEPYFINEPLLDKNLIERFKYTKEKLPHTAICLSTNASLLTPDIVPCLLKCVDIFIFSVFGITKEEYEKMMKGLDFDQTLNNISYFIKYKNEKGFRNMSFIRQVISSDFILRKGSMEKLKKVNNFWREKGIIWRYFLFSTRAGNLRNSLYNYKNIKNMSGCWYKSIPLKYIYIMFNGDVVLCCMDYNREVVLGNITRQSIYEIWNSKLYNEIRDKIYFKKSKGNQDEFLCNRCLDPRFNFFGMDYL